MSTRSDAFTATLDDAMDVREGTWDGARGERELFDFAKREDGTIDWAKAAPGFGVADLDPPEGENITRASFKLAVAYVEDGRMVAIGNALRNALARLPQTEDISDAVRAEVETRLRRLLDRLNADLADALAGHFAMSVGDARSIVDTVSDRLLALRDVVRSEDERAQIREEFPRLIDMTPTQMQAWSESPFAGENRKTGPARESARDALRRVMALKAKPMAEWTEGDYDDAVKAIAFVKRMSEVEQGEPIMIDGREGPSDRDASLRDWGHWTDAADVPTLDTFANMARGIAALPPVQARARGWSDKAIAAAVAFLGLLAPVHAHADGARVYRTCTMDFALDAEARTAVDRALEIADEIGPRTDAMQVNAIAERLRADGLGDRLAPDGRLIVTGYAARTGSQLYGDGKSTWYEYRSEDEVEKSLAGYANATFTDDHPPVLVTADNWREYARGHVGPDAQLLPPADDGHRYVKVWICIGDVSTIRKIRDGKVELSAGYTTIAVRDPGVDAHGVRYTYRQTDIQINHLALVDEGRAGPRARVQIDGQAAVFEITETSTMTKPNTDQMDPQMLMQLLDAIKAWRWAETPEAASAAAQQIGVLLEADPAMVAEHLSGGEMMEMDGVRFVVSKDAAAKIRERERKVTGDAAKIATDLAATQGELSAVTRTVAMLKAENDAANMRDLERAIAPKCPQLVKTWADNASVRPTSLTAMRVAAIVDMDAAAKVDIDKAWGPDKDKPAPTFDAFVESLFASTMRHASARQTQTRSNNDNFTQPTIVTGGFHGRNN